jgi:antitoxin (DNA-binding transcriptional repressor) of toxin-antitoxin stability system
VARTIETSEFRTNCLALVGEVARTGSSVVIAKDGRPVGVLGPHRPKQRKARGILKGELIITRGDIISPLDAELAHHADIDMLADRGTK